MQKTLIALAAAATVAGAAISAPSQANATCWGCYVGAGVVAGLVGGALIGSAGAQPYGAYYGYGPSYYYAPAPVYYGPGPGCFWRNQRVWDGYAWRIQRVQVCN